LLQSRLEKQAFQAIPLRKAGISRLILFCATVKMLKAAIPPRKAGISSRKRVILEIYVPLSYYELQSRLEKQAFQEERASNCIPTATNIVFFEYK